MAITDQFETAPLAQYSGSYTQNVFYDGTSIFRTRRRLYSSAKAPTGNTLLAVYINRAITFSGSATHVFGKALLDRENLGTVIGRLHSPSIRKFTAVNEIFSDSVLPAPPDIALRNGAKFFEGDDYSREWSTLDPGGSILTSKRGSSTSKFHTLTGSHFGQRRFKIAIGTSRSLGGFGPATLTSSTDGSQVSDDIWAYSFPFEQRYAGLPRYIKPGYHTDYKVELTQSTSYGSNGFNIHDIDPATEDPPFTGSLYNISFVHRGTNTDGALTEHYMQTVMDFQYGIAGAIPPPEPSTFTDFIAKYTGPGNIFDTLRYFYGFHASMGRNAAIAAFPETSAFTILNPGGFGNSWASVPLRGHNDINPAHGEFAAGFTSPLLNGWKQGVYNAIPTPSNCHFRYNRFGQFRDMMEQRPNTKFHDATTGRALEAAVRITFVVGTDAFITASRPTELNPNASGNFDKEGKMGKPFDDSPSGSI